MWSKIVSIISEENHLQANLHQIWEANKNCSQVKLYEVQQTINNLLGY